MIIPTYNNASSILQVVEQAMGYCRNLIVVSDGSTDGTPELLETLPDKPEIISYKKNRGTGYALSRAFAYARSRGYRHAITLDADGQHYPEEIPRFIKAMEEHPGAVIVGSRSLNQENMPRENTFPTVFPISGLPCRLLYDCRTLRRDTGSIRCTGCRKCICSQAGTRQSSRSLSDLPGKVCLLFPCP